MKDLIAGLWSALCIGLTLLWESGVDWWNKSSESQKSVMLAVVIVLVALSVWQVARAENQPNSGYGLWYVEEGAGAYSCFMNDPTKDKVGSIYTCLIMFAIGPNTLATQGNIEFCTITGMKDDLPMVDCAPSYAEARVLAGGV